MFLHLDCRHYLGDRPCRFGRPCEGCPHYAPMGPRVLLIKLGALGDVVRTACLLPGLAALPEPPHVTWLTSHAARPLVERMPGVDRVLTWEPETWLHLEAEQFDTVICLDKEPGPCALAMRVPAARRLGVGLSRYGTPMPLNEHAEYYFRLGLDDHEKFVTNQASYPRLVYDALGMTYEGQRYELATTAEDRAAAGRVLALAHVECGAAAERTLVGINAGAGRVFANKAWRPEGYLELMRELARRRPERARAIEFVLLGGDDEAELMARLAREARAAGVAVLEGGADNPLGTFAALIERCAVLVAGDTLAMHLAIALRRRVVAIFGPTCAQEIDLFGLGTKLVTPIECAPCYRRACDRSPTCQDLIAADDVIAAVEHELEAAHVSPMILRER